MNLFSTEKTNLPEICCFSFNTIQENSLFLLKNQSSTDAGQSGFQQKKMKLRFSVDFRSRIIHRNKRFECFLLKHALRIPHQPVRYRPQHNLYCPSPAQILELSGLQNRGMQ